MNIRCLLVDDEHLALALLEQFVAQIPDLQILGKCKSAVHAAEIMQQEPVDLLFLDIQMPVLSGLGLLRTVTPKPITIFTTAYPQHALEAFELDVVDYLLKPFSFERFEHAVNKARTILVQYHGAETSLDGFLNVKTDRKWVKVPFSEILYIEGWKEYVKIFTEREKIVTLESLSKLETMLPAKHFTRVHKSFIVANARVEQLVNDNLCIGTSKIPIARARKKMVLASLFQ
jgi:DNA-binding LytR/AlgR family response regulator